MLGSAHLRVLTVVGFPTATTPGILDDLNRLPLAYRWSTRAIMLDKTDATKLVTRIRRQWFAKRKSVAAILKEAMTNEASALLDTDAHNKAMDADAALSRSGFHAWLGRPPSKRSRSDEVVGAKVRASFLASDRTYGARRVWHDVLADGVSCGLHRIERLMRAQALRARPRRRRRPPDLGERPVDAVAANVLDRSFEAPAPNRKWIADFTYIWTAEGWLYVAAVLDLFSRRVVGWSMSATMTAQLVADALVMAIWRRGKPEDLLHHSDRGSQYVSEQFQRLMADHGVVCSMSRAGNVWDNAAMESFFSSLKIERTSRKTYRTRDEAKADVFDYIEYFYNPRRRHSTIGYLSPVEFEKQARLA
jgi:putative transposase